MLTGECKNIYPEVHNINNETNPSILYTFSNNKCTSASTLNKLLVYFKCNKDIGNAVHFNHTIVDCIMKMEMPTEIACVSKNSACITVFILSEITLVSKTIIYN